MIDPGLEGKTVLITGANNPLGIGAETARAFVAQGSSVLLNYLREPLELYGVREEAAREVTTPSEAFGRVQTSQNADQVIQEIRESGEKVEAMELDSDLS